MAGKQKEINSPDRTVRTKKTIGIISILICVFAAALVINGVFWIVDWNEKIHNAEEAFSELQTRSSIQNIGLSELKTASNSFEKADFGSDDVGRNMALLNEATAQSNKHSIVLEDRQNMTLTGIREVVDFNEQKIVVQTELSQLTITGRSLWISNFNNRTGDLSVAGTIDSLVYADKAKGRLWENRLWGRVPEALRKIMNP